MGRGSDREHDTVSEKGITGKAREKKKTNKEMQRAALNLRVLSYAELRIRGLPYSLSCICSCHSDKGNKKCLPYFVAMTLLQDWSTALIQGCFIMKVKIRLREQREGGADKLECSKQNNKAQGRLHYMRRYTAERVGSES